LVHEQYQKFLVEVIQTKRYISCNGKGRTGEDIIVNVTLSPSEALALMEPANKVDRFVETKFQGLYFSDEDNR
jgi:hypothetical protein